MRIQRPTKYEYVKVIQFTSVYSTYGWEDVCEYDRADTSIRADLREYRLSAGRGERYRVIERRNLNALYNKKGL